MSGQGPFNAETGTKPEGVAEQTRQTLKTCRPSWRPQAPPWTTCEGGTAHLQEVTKDFRAFNEGHREFFHEPFPVRTTVGSDLLDILVEIDVIAELD